VAERKHAKRPVIKSRQGDITKLTDALNAGKVAAVGPLHVRGLNGGTQFTAGKGFTSMLSSTADGCPWL